MHKVIIPPRSLERAPLQSKFPLPLIAFLMAMILPIEFSLYIGPVFLTPSRLIFVLLTIPMLYSFFRSEDKFSVDYMLILMTCWICFGYIVKLRGGGLQSLGQAFLETVIPYLIARQYFTTQKVLREFINIVGVIIFIMGVLAIPEAVFWVRYLHEFTKTITGIVYNIQSDTRVGLLRAASTFENPILFGLFSATMFSMIWYGVQDFRRKAILSVGCAMATALSLSSAALLLLFFQVFAIAIEYITAKVPRRTLLIMVAISLLVVIIELSSNRGVVRIIISYMTFNPHTGYYRLLQWDYAQDDVLRNPIWGMVDVGSWTRPFWMISSVDNNWLVVAMKNGIPVVLINFAIFATLVVSVYRRKKVTIDIKLKKLMTGWIIIILAIFLGGWTVALFGKMHPMLYFIVGMGVSILRMQEESFETEHPNPQDVSYQKFSPHSRFPIINRKL